MKEQRIMPFDRAIQILGLLARHGPLSVRGLQTLLEPPIKRRRLREVLQRWRDKGILYQRYDRIFGDSAVYHGITQKPMGRSLAAQVLAISPDKLCQPHFRHVELIHSEACAIWSERFRRLFPESLVLREHQFWDNPVVKRKLLLGEDTSDQLPDIIIMSAGQDGSTVAAGVEIERSIKSEKRLVYKLRKYAVKTHLDGVIYLCDKKTIADRLKLVYTSKILESALRIKHYGLNFLLLSEGTLDAKTKEPVMYNAALQRISLRDWLRTLNENKIRSRRDAAF